MAAPNFNLTWAGKFIDNGRQMFDVTHPDYGAKLDGVTDDGAAFAACAAAIQANGGGVLFAPKGAAMMFKLGTTYTEVCVWEDLPSVSVWAPDCEFRIDPARSGANKFTTSYGTLFKYTDCNNIDITIPLTTGPDVLDATSAVKGIVLHQFFGNCNGITVNGRMRVTGGAVAALLLDNEATPSALGCTNITIGALDIENSWYAIGAKYSGQTVTVGSITTTRVFRAIIGYKLDGWDIALMRVKNHQGGHVALQSIAGYGVSNFRIGTYINKGSTAAADHPQIQISYDQTQGYMRNIHIGLDVELGVTLSGGAVVNVLKLTTLGAFDTTGRGHIFRQVTFAGRTDGNPSLADNPLIGTHNDCDFAGDDFDDLTLDLIVTNGRYIRWNTSGFSGTGKGIRCRVKSNADVDLPTSRTVALTGNVKVDSRGSDFPNLHKYNAGIYGVAHITPPAGAFTFKEGWFDDRTVSNHWLAANTVGTLPAGFDGAAINVVCVNANQFEIDPNGSQQIRGGGAGKKLFLNAAGESARLSWNSMSGFWEITASNGTLSFEP